MSSSTAGWAGRRAAQRRLRLGAARARHLRRGPRRHDRLRLRRRRLDTPRRAGRILEAVARLASALDAASTPKPGHGAGTVKMTLQGKLDEINGRSSLAVLDPTDRAGRSRIRSSGCACCSWSSRGLSVGDDPAGLRAARYRRARGGERGAAGSGAARGHAFFRGPWCPYCSLTLQALERSRPRIEALGGSVVAVSPLPARSCGGWPSERGLGCTLLSDPDSAYARSAACGSR